MVVFVAEVSGVVSDVVSPIASATVRLAIYSDVNALRGWCDTPAWRGGMGWREGWREGGGVSVSRNAVTCVRLYGVT